MAQPDFISRSEARALGSKRYYTGRSCKRGHISERFVSTGACAACNRGAPPESVVPEVEQRLQNDIVWTEDIREILIDEYVNTGDIMAARELVNCSAAAYHRELEANEDFRERIKKATALAMQTIEERAIHLAKKGNDKLMIAVLKAKLGERSQSA